MSSDRLAEPTEARAQHGYTRVASTKGLVPTDLCLVLGGQRVGEAGERVNECVSLRHYLCRMKLSGLGNTG